LIWEAGYQQGDFKGHIYPDAVENLKKWKAKGLDLYVYSSGSVQAQKLLFAHTDYGDLTPLFSGYFDTLIGGKKEPQSYSNIAKNIDIPPEHLLFLSDIKEELDAAKTAGYQTTWLVREDALQAKAGHLQVSSFDHITP
jgi:enolase-phosphatase E1